MPAKVRIIFQKPSSLPQFFPKPHDSKTFNLNNLPRIITLLQYTSTKLLEIRLFIEVLENFYLYLSSTLPLQILYQPSIYLLLNLD